MKPTSKRRRERKAGREFGHLMDAGNLMDRRCSARSKQSGQRCKRHPILGGTVCRMHGGAAPQVQQSARDRIAALVHPAIDTLERALSDCDVNAAVRAARDLLDRAGFAATARHEIAASKSLAELIVEAGKHE
jgi:hypothetical protein